MEDTDERRAKVRAVIERLAVAVANGTRLEAAGGISRAGLLALISAETAAAVDAIAGVSEPVGACDAN